MTTNEIRYANAKANIEKTEKTLEKHRTALGKKQALLAKATTDHEVYCAKCDVSWAEDAIKTSERKLRDLKASLAKWSEAMALEKKRNDLPVVPAVEEFLQAWKAAFIEYMTGAVLKYKADRAAIGARFPGAHDWSIPNRERNAICEQLHEALQQLDKETGHQVLFFVDRGLDKLPAAAEREMAARRVDLYTRCTAAVGVIVDAMGLRHGNNGSINGVVIGEQGKAKVETIVAGGYNIQCLHYRVLVNRIAA